MSDSEPPDPSTYGEWLRRVFPTLREPLLSQSASRLRPEHFSAGSVIIRQGEAADSLFIIVKGRARVTRADRSGAQLPVASLGTGQFFGEMALLAGEARSASVVAESDLDVLILDREGLRQVMERDGSSTSTTDGVRVAAWPTVESQEIWQRTFRSACHALVASHHAVRSIDVLGHPVEDDEPASLIRLTELARRTASEYGIEVRVTQVGQRPVLHFMSGPLD